MGFDRGLHLYTVSRARLRPANERRPATLPPGRVNMQDMQAQILQQQNLIARLLVEVWERVGSEALPVHATPQLPPTLAATAPSHHVPVLVMPPQRRAAPPPAVPPPPLVVPDTMMQPHRLATTTKARMPSPALSVAAPRLVPSPPPFPPPQGVSAATATAQAAQAQADPQLVAPPPPPWVASPPQCHYKPSHELPKATPSWVAPPPKPCVASPPQGHYGYQPANTPACWGSIALNMHIGPPTPSCAPHRQEPKPSSFPSIAPTSSPDVAPEPPWKRLRPVVPSPTVSSSSTRHNEEPIRGQSFDPRKGARVLQPRRRATNDEARTQWCNKRLYM